MVGGGAGGGRRGPSTWTNTTPGGGQHGGPGMVDRYQTITSDNAPSVELRAPSPGETHIRATSCFEMGV